MKKDKPDAPPGSPLDNVYNALLAKGSVWGGGSDWTCPVPEHDDHRPSLGVNPGDKHPVVITCGKCKTEDVVDALGLTMDDLKAPKPKSTRRRKVASWTYTDEEGRKLFRVDRWEPKNFSQVAYDEDGEERTGRGAMKGVRRVLYKLPLVLAHCAEGGHVVITEGEKSARAINTKRIRRQPGLGRPRATTAAGGAKAEWLPDYTDALAGAGLVTIIADRDVDGLRHASEVYAALTAAELTVEVRQSKTTNAKDDVVDHFEAGHQWRDLVLLDPADLPSPVETHAQRTVAPPTEPMANARAFRDARYGDDDGSKLVSALGSFYAWSERDAFQPLEQAYLDRDLRLYFEDATYPGKDGPVRFNPTNAKVAELRTALESVVLPDRPIEANRWLSAPPGGLDPADPFIPCRNGILHVPTRSLLPCTPAYFAVGVRPLDYAPDAPKPDRWLRFLKEVMPEDPDAVSGLQEWFGYVLGGLTGAHKMALLVGTGRSGKGTIARVLGSLIGETNVAWPTMASLSTEFGLQGLLGKSLAVIPDARTGRNNRVATERLLSVVGGDPLDVNRKYLPVLSAQRLSAARLMMLSNELPTFDDASAAVVSRFLVWGFDQSFLGREDWGLSAALNGELAGILNWSLEGLDRVLAGGRLEQHASGAELLHSMTELASPVKAFLADRMEVAPLGGTVAYPAAPGEVFEEWRAWCEKTGHDPGSSQLLDRSLRAAVGNLQKTRLRLGRGSSEVGPGGGTRAPERLYVFPRLGFKTEVQRNFRRPSTSLGPTGVPPRSRRFGGGGT